MKLIPFKNKKKLLKIIPYIAMVGASTLALAQDRNDTTSGYIGLLGGGSGLNTSTSTSNSESDLKPTAGLTLGGKLTPNFGLGFMGSYYGQTSSGRLLGLPTDTSTSNVLLLGQANLFASGFHIGGEVGPAISSWSGRVSNIHRGNSHTSLAYGPVAGYDFVIGKAVSIGVEGHYLFNTAEESINNVQLFGAVKLWI